MKSIVLQFELQTPGRRKRLSASILRGQEALVAHGDQEMPIWGFVFRSIDISAPSSLVDLRIVNLNKYLESLQAK
jgi:hypothetical protein